MKIEIIADDLDVSDAELASFVLDAVTTWGGQLRPEEPLFDSLSVKRIRVRGKLFNIGTGGET